MLHQGVHSLLRYCKFGNFHENFIFANSAKRHIWDVQTSRLRHDLPISVNDIVILSFREGLIFRKVRIYAKFCKNKTLAKISKFSVWDRNTMYLKVLI